MLIPTTYSNALAIPNATCYYFNDYRLLPLVTSPATSTATNNVTNVTTPAADAADTDTAADTATATDTTDAAIARPYAIATYRTYTTAATAPAFANADTDTCARNNDITRLIREMILLNNLSMTLYWLLALLLLAITGYHTANGYH